MKVTSEPDYIEIRYTYNVWNAWFLLILHGLVLMYIFWTGNTSITHNPGGLSDFWGDPIGDFIGSIFTPIVQLLSQKPWFPILNITWLLHFIFMIAYHVGYYEDKGGYVTHISLNKFKNAVLVRRKSSAASGDAIVKYDNNHHLLDLNSLSHVESTDKCWMESIFGKLPKWLQPKMHYLMFVDYNETTYLVRLFSANDVHNTVLQFMPYISLT
jgi:hypothetical protein